jgi:HAD superfamily hydrolase (TIGR01549 family)
MSTDTPLPTGLLLDLDDTILSYDAVGNAAWLHACELYCHRTGLDAVTLDLALRKYRDAYWADPERNRLGRLRLDETRLQIIQTTLQDMNIDDATLAADLTTTFVAVRDASIDFLSGARETLEELVARRIPLALVTNGQSDMQREKIARFELERYFKVFCVEGELGFGKPDPRAFETALAGLGLGPGDVWMVGDNLEWDIRGAQQVGIFAVWNDYRVRGLPADSPVQPDRIINRLADLLAVPNP